MWDVKKERQREEGGGLTLTMAMRTALMPRAMELMMLPIVEGGVEACSLCGRFGGGL